MKIKITVGFVIAICAFWCVDGEGLMPLLVICAALHECAHLAAFRIFKIEPERLTLGFCGAEIVMPVFPVLSYTKEIAAALAGPLINVAAGVAAVFILKERGFTLAGVNFALAAINMLPASQLDGGRALHAFLCVFFSAGLSSKIVFVISCITAQVTLAAGVYIYMKSGFNLTLIAIGLYIFAGLFIGKNSGPPK